MAHDLAPLFTAEPQAVGFRQGVILAWDAGEGTNTVEVDGVALEDLPVLGAQEAVTLREGDTVGILSYRPSGSTQLFILGRVAAPDVAARGGVHITTATATATSSTMTAAEAWNDIVQVVLDVPPWATTAAVQATLNGAATIGLGSSVNANQADARVTIDGHEGTIMSSWANRTSPQVTGTAGAAHARTIAAPDATLTIVGQMTWGISPAPSAGFFRAALTVLAIFTRE